jgi:CCR4-NOT transcription complex subunit 3
MGTSARKLQAEIEKTLKKIEEGLAEFDSLREQVVACEAAGQKAKLEDELKKELKKLQKHRDAVKAWAAGGDVKDKTKLVEAKGLIERRMEAFKLIERDSKTKQYSKEGLMRSADLTPEEKRRRTTTDWIDKLLDRLNDEAEEWEKEQEALEEDESLGGGGGGGGGGKKKPSQEKSRVEVLTLAITAHRFHVEKLEQMRELTEAGRLDCDQVDSLKGERRAPLPQAPSPPPPLRAQRARARPPAPPFTPGFPLPLAPRPLQTTWTTTARTCRRRTLRTTPPCTTSLTWTP